MHKIKWTQSKENKNLTIIIVAHNLVSLFYPFIESFVSAMPLGCNFLVGDYGCTDSTMEVFKTLSKYAPITFVKGRWQPETGGTAIGLATQELLSQCSTPFVLNLQANEILCEDCYPNILIGARPLAFKFRHFWGNFNFDGGQGYGYGEAPRIYSREQKGLDHGDGCWVPPGNNFAIWPLEGGTIHRYSYCFCNQVAAKSVNHFKLYLGHAQTPEQRLNAINWCKQHPNFYGSHPECVKHFIGQENYDIVPNWVYLSNFLIPL